MILIANSRCLLLAYGAREQEVDRTGSSRSHHHPALLLCRDRCVFYQLEVQDTDIKSQRLIVVAHQDRHLTDCLAHRNAKINANG